MDYLIKDIGSLTRLRQDKNLKNSIRKIRIAEDTPVQAKQYEPKLNRYYFACGCKESAIGIYLTLIGYALLWATNDIPLLSAWWQILLTLVSIAIIGKLFGLLLAGYRLKQIFDALEVCLLKRTSR